MVADESPAPHTVKEKEPRQTKAKKNKKRNGNSS
jgi:hypothetical protein